MPLSDRKKRKIVDRFCELDRMGLIEHDWSRVEETGRFFVKIRLDKAKPASTLIN